MKPYQLYNISIMIILIFSTGCITTPSPTQNPPGVENISNKAFPNYTGPIWSPSGDKLVVTDSSWERLKSDIYIIDIASKTFKKFLEIDGIMHALAWSPDGSQIAVGGEGTSYSDGIWLFNLINKSSNYLGPGDQATWSPDGKQMAIYSCERDKNGSISSAFIYLLDLSTMERKNIFKDIPCEGNAYLDWSPDGRTLAFSYSPVDSTKMDSDQVYLLDITSGQTVNITDKGNWSPSWAPSGKLLAFVNNYMLAVSDNTGSCVKKVDNLGTEIGTVSWSPDGTKWAASNSGNIFIIDIPTIMGDGFLKNGISCP
jgi:Tol biopolymer transport system component